MKISDYIIIVLIIGLCFTAFGSIINDFEISYPDVEINKTSWEGKYNFTDEIDNRSLSLKADLEDIINAGSGWKVFAEGALALPNAIVNVVSILFFSMGKGVLIFSGILSSFGVPSFVQGVGVVIMTILVIFEGISFYHRGKA